MVESGLSDLGPEFRAGYETSTDIVPAALVIQDLQNDVIIEGGAFADSDAPEHAKSSDRER